MQNELTVTKYRGRHIQRRQRLCVGCGDRVRASVTGRAQLEPPGKRQSPQRSMTIITAPSSWALTAAKTSLYPPKWVVTLPVAAQSKHVCYCAGCKIDVHLRRYAARTTTAAGATGGYAMERILVVDGDAAARASLQALLEHAGYEVIPAASGLTGLTLALSEPFDLIVLELTLPDISGDEVLCVLMSARPPSTVLLLSAESEVGRRAQVLDDGAADVVTKPYADAELLARIRLRLRERRPPVWGASRVLELADWQLDPLRETLLAHGQRIPLTHREYILLKFLLARRGEVCSRRQILEEVWNTDFDPGTNIVDVLVGRLRAKLGGHHIQTVRHVGYRLVA